MVGIEPYSYRHLGDRASVHYIPLTKGCAFNLGSISITAVLFLFLKEEENFKELLGSLLGWLKRERTINK